MGEFVAACMVFLVGAWVGYYLGCADSERPLHERRRNVNPPPSKPKPPYAPKPHGVKPEKPTAPPNRERRQDQPPQPAD